MPQAPRAPLTEEEIDHAAALLRTRIGLFFLVLAERLFGEIFAAPLQAWIARTRRTVTGLLLLRALRRASPVLRRAAAPGRAVRAPFASPFRRLTRTALGAAPGDAAAHLRLLQAALDNPEAPVARLIKRLERGPHGGFTPCASEPDARPAAPACAAPVHADTS